MVNIGGKTAIWPDVEQVKSFEDVDRYLRQIKDIIEELIRRRWTAEALGAGKVYLAKVTSLGSTDYTYTCTLYYWDKITNLTEYKTGQDVYNLVDAIEEVAGASGKGLVVNNYMVCWLSADKIWVGVEVHGRSTVGLCVEA